MTRKYSSIQIVISNFILLTMKEIAKNSNYTIKSVLLVLLGEKLYPLLKYIPCYKTSAVVCLYCGKKKVESRVIKNIKSSLQIHLNVCSIMACHNMSS